MHEPYGICWELAQRPATEQPSSSGYATEQPLQALSAQPASSLSAQPASTECSTQQLQHAATERARVMQLKKETEAPADSDMAIIFRCEWCGEEILTADSLFLMKCCFDKQGKGLLPGKLHWKVFHHNCARCYITSGKVAAPFEPPDPPAKKQRQQ